MARRPAPPDDGAAPAPARRAPFAANPAIGARGLRTQQRILDAALSAFGDSGYDRTTLEDVARLAGCSRITIYQYFSGKDDLFRQLAGQVARQLRASLEALGPVTADAGGHAELRSWIARHADIEARYEPIMRAFEAAAATDPALAGGAASVGRRHLELFQARLDGVDVPARLIDPTVELLLAGVTRSLGLASMLRAAAATAYPADRVELAVTDVVHRALFGRIPEVNVHAASGERPPALRLGPAASALFDRVGTLEADALDPGRRALAAILATADDLLIGRGYRGVRVDHVVEAAGVSRGSFYTYFENIEDFVRVVAVRAVHDVSVVVRALPDVATRAALRPWLRRYGAVHASKGPLVRVWVEAVDDTLRDERAAVFDWGRRRLAGLLADRGFGDVDVDGLLLLAVLEVFGSVPRSDVELDAALLVVERGFLP